MSGNRLGLSLDDYNRIVGSDALILMQGNHLEVFHAGNVEQSEVMRVLRDLVEEHYHPTGAEVRPYDGTPW